MKIGLCIFLLLAGMVNASEWKERLEDELPLLGHRNWVVVADSAYPLQTAPGIYTVYAGGDHVEVVKEVLGSVSKQTHVRPVIFTDTELNYVDETHAPGIGDFRKRLNAALDGATVETLPHMDIINELDAAGETFRVVLIKTDLTLPYTSVFMRLDCGYWSSEAEDALRKAMEK
ncbi:hypothetical protein [Pelagicoccus mobilis]|uniref:D-ribose pyranase n=1 Tax=Pelagicoccus mobilis TaxID=415221 RepID=A0A934VPJ5_9BACT|nr:hypothetical protein [Pelagicoccus mobilis]MBK1875885.1 hypothetical protein [Pelagicoccus mobilis]